MPAVPDFDVVERTLERRFEALNLPHRRFGENLDPGLPGLRLRRGETQTVSVGDERWYASAEINALLTHPTTGEIVISDLVSTQGQTAEEALARCAEFYADVTFPALHALYDESASAGPPFKLSSVNPQGQAVQWQGLRGTCQVLPGEAHEATQYFGSQLPLLLVFDTLTGYLGRTRLHWCKLYAAQTPKGFTFGCAIDGRKDAKAEAEMRRKFAMPPQPDPWEFRQFYLFAPSGVPDEALAAELRTRQEALPGQPRRFWWPFGRR